MGIGESLLMAIGLAMDAFAVSVCKGLSVKQLKTSHMIKAGAYFGGFQALMPLIGFLVGIKFEKYITAYDHWIVFGLLLIIGGKMVFESFKEAEEELNSSFAFKTMVLLALATSIDALAVGVSLAFLGDSILIPIIFIGVITFILSAVGVRIGNVFGRKYKSKAELTGGIILILIGTKILFEHLGII